MKPPLGRLLAVVIVGAILLYLIWWVVGVLAVVVLVAGVVKVWQWCTAIRPPKSGVSPRSKPALIAASAGVPAAVASEGSTSVESTADGVNVRAVPAAAAPSPDAASTGPTRDSGGCHPGG